MNRLCGNNIYWPGTAIGGYKVILNFFEENNYDTAHAWMVAGYYDWPVASTPMGDRSWCSATCPIAYAGAPFRYRWGTVGYFDYFIRDRLKPKIIRVDD
jgi:hypothetical protein